MIHPSPSIPAKARAAGAPTTDGPDLTWPAERFFWGTLDAPGIRKAGVLPSAMTLTLADVVPVPIDDLHAVIAPLPDDRDRILVCAARRSELEPLLASARSLRPAMLPAFIEPKGTTVDTAPLNLLVGVFEPVASRERRHRTIARGAMLWTCLMLLLGVGLWRREAAWYEDAQILRTARAAMLEAALPGALALDLHAEVERVAEVLEARKQTQTPRDVTATLAAFLRGWPARTGQLTDRPEIQSISLDPDRLALSVVVDGDPSVLLAHLHAPEGWTLKEPRLTSVGAATRLSLEMVASSREERGR